uniref:Uncharacterized protein n=1 Tax=Anguilla anguilla TaxID=7936 RepID=A0A0E9PSP3_ANGAN
MQCHHFEVTGRRITSRWLGIWKSLWKRTSLHYTTPRAFSGRSYPVRLTQLFTQQCHQRNIHQKECWYIHAFLPQLQSTSS